MTNIIPINHARQHLGEIVEEAHFLSKPFVITRGNRPMAALIGTNELARILDLIEKYDPGLADTLAIMSNPEIQELLEAGEKNIQAGKVLPFDKSLLEL
jgi:PHD/YefM family antitoxin component YafN of YafNO toxin-antitoxin module